MNTVQSLPGTAVVNGTPKVITVPVNPNASLLDVVVTATFGAVSGTNGVNVTATASADGVTFVPLMSSLSIAGTANASVAGELAIRIRNPHKQVAGAINFVKLSIANADVTNSVAVDVMAQSVVST